jgi:predicted nuclease of predicted toxin-antitoxin system
VIIWTDAHISPAIAPWISRELGVSAVAIRDLGLRDAKDLQIFNAAREANAIVLTKDSDFAVLLERLGPPPAIIWVRCGNTSNANLKRLLSRTLLKALELFGSGERLVEIADHATEEHGAPGGVGE